MVFVTGSCEPTTTVSGLSSRPDCSRPAITRPVRRIHYSLIVTSGEWRVTSGPSRSALWVNEHEPAFVGAG